MFATTFPDQTEEMMATATKMRPEDIASLPEDEWRRLVDRDLRTLTARQVSPEDRDLSAALRSIECIDRYYFTLLRMLKNVEGTLAARREEMVEQRNHLLAAGKTAEWHQFEAQYANQRKSSLRFKSGMEQTFLDIKFLRERMREGRASSRVRDIQARIKAHRDSFPSDDEPSDADLDLWRILEEG